MIYLFGAAYETPEIYLHKSRGEKEWLKMFAEGYWALFIGILFQRLFFRHLKSKYSFRNFLKGELKNPIVVWSNHDSFLSCAGFRYILSHWKFGSSLWWWIFSSFVEWITYTLAVGENFSWAIIHTLWLMDWFAFLIVVAVFCSPSNTTTRWFKHPIAPGHR